MEAIFVSILNMSIVSCIVVAAVTLIRLILRKAPKAFFCILWALVGLRLICPLTFQSPVCLVPDTQPIIEEAFFQETVSVKVTQPDKKDETSEKQTPEINEQSEPPVQNSTEVIQNHTEAHKHEEQTDRYDSVPSEITEPTVSSDETIQPQPVKERNMLLILLTYIWVAGATLMFVGALIRYFLLTRRLHGIVPDENGVYYNDRVDTPFILGVISPKIYLPSRTKESDKEYILAHERTHLRRRDHLWKPIGFAILCLHWFNPLVWLAFYLFCKDIELACDERVVCDYSLDKRKEYSYALVNCSVQQKALSNLPLCFGEFGVKERVINVLSYKKPAFWVIMTCILAVAGIGIFFMTNPVSSNNTKPIQNSEKESSAAEENDTYVFPADVPEEKAVVAKNGKRKITSREFAEILSSSEFNDDIMKAVVCDGFEWDYGGYNPKIADDTLWEKVYKLVQEIQTSADYVFAPEYINTIPPENKVPMYYYWPDSNEQSERRIGLVINNKEMVLSRIEYDEYGDIDSMQVIYSYPYELEKAAIKKYGCSEERNSRRLSNPYTKIIRTLPVSPDSGKKLKGEEALVPDEIAYSQRTKTRNCYFETLQKKYEKTISGTEALNGTLDYQKQIALGKAYPNMQKVTTNEVVEIFDKAPIYEGFDYDNTENTRAWVVNNLKEIKKIQYFADVDGTEHYEDSYWLYWPDSDNFEERKQEIQIFGEGIVRVAVYDENGNRVSLEDVFNLQKKIQKMKDEGIPFDEYPLKRKVTPEEVKLIFENAEIDPNADYTDREVCIEWTMERIKEIEKIQPFPDWKTENKNDTLFYCYWPESNSIGYRKKEIQINCETGTAILYNYEGVYAQSETLFDLLTLTWEQNQ